MRHGWRENSGTFFTPLNYRLNTSGHSLNVPALASQSSEIQSHIIQFLSFVMDFSLYFLMLDFHAAQFLSTADYRYSKRGIAGFWSCMWLVPILVCHSFINVLPFYRNISYLTAHSTQPPRFHPRNVIVTAHNKTQEVHIDLQRLYSVITTLPFENAGLWYFTTWPNWCLMEIIIHCVLRLC